MRTLTAAEFLDELQKAPGWQMTKDPNTHQLLLFVTGKAENTEGFFYSPMPIDLGRDVYEQFVGEVELIIKARIDSKEMIAGENPPIVTDEITTGEFVQKLIDADEYVFSADPLSGRPILTVRNYLKDSAYGACTEEKLIGPNPMGRTPEEFAVFYLKIRNMLNEYRLPRRLIGYRIGDDIYHPSDVLMVYEGDVSAEPITDASPGESSPGAT